MGVKYLSISFTFTKEQFIEMLLLNGSIEVPAIEIESSKPLGTVIIKSLRDHEKRGHPGVEDGSSHFFNALITFQCRIFSSNVSARSTDDGKNYSATLTITTNVEN